MFKEGLLEGKRNLITGGGTGLDMLSDADWERMRAKIKAQNEKDRAGRVRDRAERGA